MSFGVSPVNYSDSDSDSSETAGPIKAKHHAEGGTSLDRGNKCRYKSWFRSHHQDAVSGALPIEGIVDIRALVFFGSICRLPESATEKSLARRQLAVKDHRSI